MNKLSNGTLQAYTHEVGLEAFLRQLEEVFQAAEDDTEDFDVKAISSQYQEAHMSITALREELFPATKDNKNEAF